MAPRSDSPLSRLQRQRLLLDAARPVSGRRRSLPVLDQHAVVAPLAAQARDIDLRVVPRHAVWELTLQCDLGCRHCGSRAGKARPGELDTAECLDVVDQLAELGVQEVTLIGGEAYLRPDWLEIVRAIRAHGMDCGMTSGGRGIDSRRAHQAAEAGLQTVSISLDGLAQTHDRLRGARGAFRSGLAALTNLREAGVPVGVNTQINRLSMSELEDLLEVIIAHGVHSWQVMLTVAMGRAVDEPEVLCQPHDMLALFPLLDLLKERCEQAGVRLWPGNNLGYFGPYESRLRGSLPRGHGTSCGAGRGTLGIEADGSIKGCPSLPSDAWTGGNLRDSSLRDIWQRAPALRYTRDRTVDDLWGFCRTCYYADTCRAGCTWTSYVLFGKAGNNPYCHHRALELERAGKRERVVRIAEAPNRPFDHGLFELVIENTPQPIGPCKI
jgi:radical SAM protein with 4Fe4S-binding SPASM domain